MEVEGHKETVEAGEILRKTVEFAKGIVKKDKLLLEIAEAIENKIAELGGKPAFPVNLSINEIAAHYTPNSNDTQKARGLLKVDIGVHVEGYSADTAFSVDLEGSELNKKLIHISESALKKGMELISSKSKFGEVGKEIELVAKNSGFNTIRNLTGHKIEQYQLHAGSNVPNYDDGSLNTFGEGIFAVEPFVTNGTGMVKNGELSGIYELVSLGQVRDRFALEVLEYIAENYSTLPFCSRWLNKKFGSRVALALHLLERAGIITQFRQLVETSKGIVAQSEHTVILGKEKKIVT